MEKALDMVKKLSPAEKVKAGHTWNSFSGRLQAILNSSVSQDYGAPVGFSNPPFNDNTDEQELCCLQAPTPCNEVVMNMMDFQNANNVQMILIYSCSFIF